jgi:hypothetical protein
MCVALDVAADCMAIFDGLHATQHRCTGALPQALPPGGSDETFQCQQLAAEVAAGTVTFNGQKYQTCLNELASTSCDVPDLSYDCEAAFGGTVADFASCHDSFECQHSWCRIVGGCPGQCMPAQGAGVGADCTQGCQPPLICAGTPGTCQEALAIGVTCDPTQYQCQPGAVCDSTTTKCVAGAQSGACMYDTQCALGYHCATQPGSCAKTCVALRQVGENCSVDTDCVAGAYCLGNSCASPPILGQACGLIGGEQVRCIDSYCNATHDPATGLWNGMGSCVARIALGAACDSTAPDGFVSCVSGAQCNSTVCQAFACF